MATAIHDSDSESIESDSTNHKSAVAPETEHASACSMSRSTKRGCVEIDGNTQHNTPTMKRRKKNFDQGHGHGEVYGILCTS